MDGSTLRKLARYLIVFALLLSALGPVVFAQDGAPSTPSLGSPPEYAYGDIMLDPATYEQYIQVMPDSMVEALPASYDARSDGIVTPPKNQGSCGSCWAFASTGAMESHIQKIFGFGLTDLSEQQILSCNAYGYSCGGGSSDAPRYWESDGPIYETCFPYQANDTVPCSNASGCPRLDFRVTNWHTVASDQFKASLYYDGPSYWRYTVYSDFPDWWDNAASGSVYVNAPGTSVEGGHAVLLIGWDDAKGAYLCKNSWGATGGPQGDGTFWIAYSGHYNNLSFGMSNFGLISLLPPPNAPTGLTATAISQHQINLAWTDASSNEAGFKIERAPFAPGSWTQIATVGANVTTYPNTSLASGTTYYYRVRAYNASGDSAYSNEAHATTSGTVTWYYRYLPVVFKNYTGGGTVGVLWNQPLSTVDSNVYVDQDFTDDPSYSSYLADDFINPSQWSIHNIFVPGGGWNGFTSLYNAVSLTWQIYADCSGAPCGNPSGGSAPVWSLTLAPTNAQVTITTGAGGYPSNTLLELASPVSLPAGQWWLVFYPAMSFSSYGQYGRHAADTVNGYTGQFINPGGGFGLGTTWQPWSAVNATEYDIAFRLEGY